MNCPNCREEKLRPVFTKQGVEIDHCDKCGGVWLDKGEILYFVKNQRAVSEKLNEAIKSKRPTDKLSPRTGEPMVEITYPGGPHIDLCTSTGGLWFDSDELAALINTEKDLHVDIDRGKKEGTFGRKKYVRRAVSASARGGMLALPNLIVRSTTTLLGLYALLLFVMITAVEFAGVDLKFAVAGAAAVVILQFVFGPFFMDMSLRCFYQMSWVSPDKLPGHLRKFVEGVSKERKLKFPRFGIINDGAPQAFTYGHTPGNARIILSAGMFDLLEPEEVEAVVAHEIGHAVHWDMLLMTVAQLVPLILFYIYRSMVSNKKSGSGSKKGKGGNPYVAIGAYVLYIVSVYIVKWFSRTREYHADRFSGTITKNPSALSSALVKIAYGLAGQAGETARVEGARGKSRSPNMEAIGALGIFDNKTATAMAVASFSESFATTGKLDKENVKGAMRWDIWNPWAKWYELHSTHPLVANRLRYLSDQAVHMGQEPFVVFDEEKPESYWDEFFVDIMIHLLPYIALLSGIGFTAYAVFRRMPVEESLVLPVFVFVLGAAMLFRFRFSYRGGYFPAMTVSSLLKKVKVSAVRPVPCSLKGMIIGRGVPGYIISEDFVMKDQTGIMFLDYRQPLAIWELLFGLLKAGGYQGKEVIVNGWYRRAPMPYVEIRSIVSDGSVNRSWVSALYKMSSIFVIVVGIIWFLRNLML